MTESRTETAIETETDTPRDCEQFWDESEKWKQTFGERVERLQWDETRDRLFVRTEGQVSAVTPDGKQLWQRSLPEGGVVSWTDSRIVVNDSDTILVATVPSFDRQWSFSLDEKTDFLAAALGDRIYVLANKYPNQSEKFEETFVRLYVLDAATGDVVWRLDDLPEGPATWDIHAAAGNVFLHNDNGHFLTVTGDKSVARQREPFDGESIEQWGGVSNGTLYVIASDDALHALSVANGDAQWRYSAVSSIVDVTDGAVIFSRRNYNEVHVLSLDINSRQIRWKTSLDGEFLSTSTVSDAIAYLGVEMRVSSGSDTTRIYALNINTGCSLGYYETNGSSDLSPVVTSSSVYSSIAGEDSHGVYNLNAV